MSKREFKVLTFKFGEPQRVSGMEAVEWRDRKIEALLNDGWELVDRVICSPMVTLIFGREREANNDSHS